VIPYYRTLFFVTVNLENPVELRYENQLHITGDCQKVLKHTVNTAVFTKLFTCAVQLMAYVALHMRERKENREAYKSN
jgi:hypothetical protein